MKLLPRALAATALFSACLSAAPALAQRPDRTMFRQPHFVEPASWSLGITLGVSDLWGDVGTQGIVDHYANGKYTDNIKALGSIYVRRSFRPALAARFGIGYGRLYAHDNWNETKAKQAETFEDDALQRYIRNQDVRTDIWETYLVAEISPLRFNDNSRMARRRFQPYAVLGLGYFYNRPFSQLKTRSGAGGGRYVDISALRLEGQEFKDAEGKPLEGAPERDKLFHLSVNGGLGVRWDIGKHLGLGAEWMYRYTFTDQIDGVSTNYIDPALFDANLNAKDAGVAKEIYDKSWEIIPNYQNAPGALRGNSSVKDGYSSVSINFFWRILAKHQRWWW